MTNSSISTKVPLFVPQITASDKNAILKSLKSPQLTDGPVLRKFEKNFAEFVQSKYAMGVSNGTSALILALKCLDIGKDDEVIIPDMTFIATANAVIETGAIPILVDVDNSLNISPKSIKKKISKRTKAIIPVHFAGYPCDIHEIMKIAKKNGLKVVEDCAHSLGVFVKKRHVGTFGDCGCFSFYPTKIITTIEGGMVITNSKKLSDQISSLRNQGLNKNLIQRDRNVYPWSYDVINPGYNYRLDEVRASLGLSQLKRIKQIASKRINAAKYYNKKLHEISGLSFPKYVNENSHVYHLYIIRIMKKFGFSRDYVHRKLYRKGIRTTVHYKPIHKFSYFKKFYLKDKDFPNTISSYNELLTLPLFPTISKKQQDYVIKSLKGLQSSGN